MLTISVGHYDYPVFDSLARQQAQTVRLGIPGEHNIYNALAVSCVAYRVGILVQEIARIIWGQVLRNSHRMSQRDKCRQPGYLRQPEYE